MEIVVGTYEELLLGYKLKTDTKGFSIKLCFTNHLHKGCVKSVAVNQQGLLASGSSDETIQLFDLRRGKELGLLMHHEGSITSLNFYKKSHLFSTGEDGTLSIWKTHTWESLRTLRGHKGPANSLSVHPSGKIALSVSKDKTLRTWNLVKGRSAYITNLHEDLVLWAPKGDRYVVVLNNKLCVYSVETAQIENTLQKRGRIISITFLQDGKLVLSGEGGMIEFYDLLTMEKLYEFDTNTNRVRGLCCCPPPVGVEGTCLVTASSDGHIKVWQVSTPIKADSWSHEMMAEINTKFRLTCLAVWHGKKVDRSDDIDVKVEESEDDEDIKTEISNKTADGVVKIEQEASPKSLKHKITETNSSDEDDDTSKKRKRIKLKNKKILHSNKMKEDVQTKPKTIGKKKTKTKNK